MLIKNILEQQKQNKKIALVHGNRAIAYRELYLNAKKLMQIIGETSNSNNVAIMLPNSIEYVVSYFAIAFLDKVVVALSTDLSEEQLYNEIVYSEVDTILTNTLLEDKITSFLRGKRMKINIINVETNETNIINTQHEYTVNNNKINGSNENDVVLLIHTSGTNNSPKKVMLTHRNLISNAIAIINSLKLDKCEKTLIVLPMCLSTANIQMIQHLYLGCTIHIARPFFIAHKILEYVNLNRITNISCVAFMIRAFIEIEKTNTKTTTLKNVCVGGGPTPIEDIIKFNETFTHTNLVTMYGQTEASPRITQLTGKDTREKVGSVGKALPGIELKIFKDAEMRCDEKGIGEIVIKGDNIMKGYYKEPETTRKVIFNGYLYTGDIGKKDNDGFVYIIGRKKNLIIINGMNIYPERIEAVLKQYKGIQDAYVYSNKSDYYSEKIEADITTSNNSVNICELMVFCRKRLSAYQIPKKINVVKEIKKTKTMKVLRNK